jgi:hypothetical protein
MQHSPHHEVDASASQQAAALFPDHIRASVAAQSQRLRLLGLALLIALGVAVQAWAALHWRANLDGDESIFGLMARHALAGRLAPYMYGQQYQGTLEPLLAAGLIRLFGDSIFVIRLGSVLLFGVFLSLHAALVYRLWGFRVALVSLLFLALPGRFILHWTYRPITNFGPMAICGTGMLLLAQLPAGRGWSRFARLAGIGLLAGVGVWSQPLAAIYVAALGLVWLLGTPEWRALYDRLADFCARVVQIPARELLPLAALGLFGLAVLVLFTGACEPAISYRRPRQVALLGLAGLGAALPVLLLAASRRRAALLGGATSVVAGFALGNAPQWGAWLFGGVAPSPTIFPACPTDSFVRLRMSLRDIYPLVWGAPLWTELTSQPILARLLWLAALALALASLAAFAWANRTTLWSLLGMAPIPRERQPLAALALLFAIPATIILFGGNTVDWTSVRYLLISWQAASAIMALFLARLAARWRGVAALLALFWALQVGLGNLGAASQAWAGVGEPYGPEPVAALQQFLDARGVRGGYADYWAVYPLSLVSQERLLLAPYNGTDRLPETARQVEHLPLQAYLVRPGLVPAGSASADELARALLDRDRMGSTGPVFPRFGELLHGATVLERRTVGRWDVWIVKKNAK